MPSVPPVLLQQLQQKTDHIRNLCILAHVDHGKTTLSDSLISSNGIISENLAGKVRYLDNRKDEQERMITMKSSSISLLYQSPAAEASLINLIDSPGHVDFSGEVSSAVRICDGAFVLVDVVEGVCIQTHTVLRQAWQEQLSPCLVLNKIDRLVTELQRTPEEAYQQLVHIMEQTNVIMSTLFTEKAMEEEEGTEEMQLDDSELYFAPEKGNVLFCSAIDGWGFRLSHFGEIWGKKLGCDAKKLESRLWGEYYFSPKKGTILSSNKTGRLQHTFPMLVLQPIWQLYEACATRQAELLEKILTSLGIEVPRRELRVLDDKRSDWKPLLRAIIRRWLPLAPAALAMAVDQMPSPVEAQAKRVPSLWGQLPPLASDELKESHASLQESLVKCDSSADSAVVAFVSKVFAAPLVDSAVMETTKRIAVPKPRARLESTAAVPLLLPEEEEQRTPIVTDGVAEVAAGDNDDELEVERKEKFVGFARIFSGVISLGMTLHVLGPRYDPREPNKHRQELVVKELYLLMGSALEPVASVPAGNVFGIGGVEGIVLKTATICSTPMCTSFSPVRFAPPVVTVAVEPRHARDMRRLLVGLALLDQADASVEVAMRETGEHEIGASGELHLERCLRDLREMFAPIELEVSPPIVRFKETVIKEGIRQYKATQGLTALKLRVVPLPPLILELLIESEADIASLCIGSTRIKATKEFTYLQDRLKATFEEAGWLHLLDRVWSFGPGRSGPNLLINGMDSYASTSYWSSVCDMASAERLEEHETESDEEWNLRMLQQIDSSLVNGFQLAMSCGPLAEEPLHGVAVFVEDIQLRRASQQELDSSGPFNGQVMAIMQQQCRRALEKGAPHLVEPMYLCDVRVPDTMLGATCAVIGRKRGKITRQESRQGTHIFQVQAFLPVAESFGFSLEMLKKTSGAASCQLAFSHWELLDQDPNWEPTTEDELEEFGDNVGAKGTNRARELADAVRRRKGLNVEERLVEHADKQRTLSRKK